MRKRKPNSHRRGNQRRKRQPAHGPAFQTHAEAFDIAGFCKRYGICRDSAYEEIRKGRLMARKLGRRTIIASADAAQWLKELPPLKLHEAPASSA
jgi:hypothetical protein